MSFVAHGLKCESCDHKEAHAFYRRSDGPPPCPDCGGARSVDWSHGKFPGVKGDGYKSFKPVDMGVLGMCDTREKFNRAMAVIQERFPDKHIEVEQDTQTDKQTRIDESRHRAHEQRKGWGLDTTIKREIQQKRHAIKQEAAAKAVKHNKNPKAAYKKANLGKSPAALVGNKGV